MAATIADVILLSCCAFSGNIGAALTGFGQAIIFLFVWQIVELAGYHGDFKFAVFIQALSLFSMQPLLLYKAEVRKHAMRRVLLLFVPITLISTPLGQLTSDKVPTKTVQSVAGILVIFVSLWELYCKRHWIIENSTKCCNTKAGATTKAANQDDAIDEKDEKKESSGTSNDNNQENRTNTENQQESTYHNESCEVKNPQTQNDADPENLQLGNNDQQQNIEETRQPNQQPQANEEKLKIGPNKATFYTLVAGGASGFLGGMVAIRGPPLIFYFLHPPHPIAFTKDSQRATGVVIMFFNVSMRMIFYLVDTFSASSTKEYFIKEDWRLYLSVIVCSIAGGWLGTKLFVYLKDSKDTIRGILSIFLLVCGVSLVISAFS